MSLSLEQERRNLIEEQDREYNAMLKASKDDQELELAKIIALSIEESEDAELKADLEEIRQIELLTLQSFPILVYPLSKTKKEDIYLLRFKLPKSIVEYSFDRREPMYSVENVIKFALQCNNNIQLLIPVKQKIYYHPNASIEDAGIRNKSIVIVEQIK